MFKKKNSYELDVRGITFWRKKISENNTEVFVKDSLNEPFILYIDKVKDDNYYDLVTGRLFDMEDMGKDFLLTPSNIRVPKEKLTKGDRDKVVSVLENKNREEYINISEGIIYDSHFCNIISSKYGLDVIPVNFVYEEIRETKKIYNDKNNTKCKTLKQK